MRLTSTRTRLVAGFAAGAIALTLGPAALAAAAPTAGADLAPLIGTDSADAIPGAYIVVLKDDASVSPSTAAARATSLGGSVSFTYAASVHGYAATLSSAALAGVRADSSVSYVEADATASLDDVAPSREGKKQKGATWGIDRVDQRALPLNQTYKYKLTGQGVHAYVIDTGINLTHKDFGDRAETGIDLVDGGAATDCNGHGTHVSGTIGGTTYGIAKDVSLVAVRILDCGGSGTVSGIIAGVDWTVGNAQLPAVANMSIRVQPVNPTLEAAVRAGTKKGIVFAVSAGNFSGDACTQSPASEKSAITVGATDNTDRQASFSNFGKCVDIYAPGVNITSDWIGSDTATNTISGTSMSTPHVAGVAALYLSAHPSDSVKQVTKALKKKSTKGVITGIGAGSPNKLLFSLVK